MCRLEQIPVQAQLCGSAFHAMPQGQQAELPVADAASPPGQHAAPFGRNRISI